MATKFSMKDAENHQMGANMEQKKKWVREANKMLSKCMKAGGSAEHCSSVSISEANIQVMSGVGKRKGKSSKKAKMIGG